MQRLSDDVLRIMFGFVAPLDVHALLLVDKQWSALAAQIVRGDLKYRRLIKKHVAEIHDDMGAGFACVSSDFRHSIHHLPIQLAVKVVCAPAQVQLRDVLDSGRLRGRQGLPWGVGGLPSDGRGHK